MDDGLGLQSKVLGLICAVFVLIAVSYGISVVSNSSSNATFVTGASSSVVTAATASRAKLLSKSTTGDSTKKDTTSTGPVLKEYE